MGCILYIGEKNMPEGVISARFTPESVPFSPLAQQHGEPVLTSAFATKLPVMVFFGCYVR